MRGRLLRRLQLRRSLRTSKGLGRHRLGAPSLMRPIQQPGEEVSVSGGGRRLGLWVIGLSHAVMTRPEGGGWEWRSTVPGGPIRMTDGVVLLLQESRDGPEVVDGEAREQKSANEAMLLMHSTETSLSVDGKAASCCSALACTTKGPFRHRSVPVAPGSDTGRRTHCRTAGCRSSRYVCVRRAMQVEEARTENLG